jgi:hypothetical protein
MFANPTRILQFRTRSLTGTAWAGGVPAMRVHAGADVRRDAPVRRLTARPVLACRWVAVARGRLECHWGIEVDDGASVGEPKGNWQKRRIGLPFDDQQSHYRQAAAALEELEA